MVLCLVDGKNMDKECWLNKLAGFSLKMFVYICFFIQNKVFPHIKFTPAMTFDLTFLMVHLCISIYGNNRGESSCVDCECFIFLMGMSFFQINLRSAYDLQVPYFIRSVSCECGTCGTGLIMVLTPSQFMWSWLQHWCVWLIAMQLESLLNKEDFVMQKSVFVIIIKCLRLARRELESTVNTWSNYQKEI